MQNRTISFVIPLYNEADVFSSLQQEIIRLMDSIQQTYEVELIIVDDGSRDSTWDKIENFASRDQRIRGIRLSRNFGHQIALSCGYHYSKGDAVISLDGDLQDPPEVSLQLIESWEKGNDIVYAIRRNRQGESRFKLWTAHLFYRILARLGETDAPLDCGDFRLMSRPALDALLKMQEKHLYLRGMVGWIGYKSSQVYYERPPRKAGLTKFSLLKMIRFSMDGIISFSRFPLRICMFLSILASLPFLAFLVYAVFLQLLGIKPIADGWTSLLLCIVVFGSLILVSLGILGEYVGRIFELSQNRPLYLVMNRTEDNKN